MALVPHKMVIKRVSRGGKQVRCFLGEDFRDEEFVEVKKVILKPASSKLENKKRRK